MKEAIKTIQIKLNIGKLQLIIFSVILALAIIGILFYKFDLHTKAYAYVYRSDVTVTVVEAESADKYLPAEITLTNTKNGKFKSTVKANDEGVANFAKLVRGDYKVEAKNAGYNNFSGTLALKKGKSNVYEVNMVKTPPETVEFSGSVKNFISELPISGATVTIGEQKTITDKDGLFTVPNIVTGEYDIAISYKGFLSKSQKLTLTKENTKADLTLVPQGKVVFVSNRDKGKKGIYISNYDGSESKLLIARSGETEDFSPILSPDYKKVAFLSTRDGLKENGSEIYSLYLVDIDGKNLTKIADHVLYNELWTANSKYLIYSTNKSVDGKTTNEAYVYDVSKKSANQIYSLTNSTYSGFYLNESNAKLAYSIGDYSKNEYSLYVYDIAGNSASKILTDTKSLNLLLFKGENELVYNYYLNNKNYFFNFNLSDNSNSEIQYEYPKRILVKSPDGKTFAFTENRDGKSNVYTSDSKGANEKQITSLGTVASAPYWSLGGKLLFFNSFKEGENALFVASVDGGQAKKITDVTSAGYGGMDGM